MTEGSSSKVVNSNQKESLVQLPSRKASKSRRRAYWPQTEYHASIDSRVVAEWNNSDSSSQMSFDWFDDSDLKENDTLNGDQGENKSLILKIIDSLNHPFLIIDVSDYSVKLANAAALASSNGLCGACYSISHNRESPCDGSGELCPVSEVKRSGKSLVVEHIHYDQQQRPRFVEVHAHPIFDRDGRVVQVIEYCLDVTERKQAQARLLAEQERYRILVETSRDLVFALMQNGEFAFISHEALERILGYRPEELLGRHFADFAVPERVADLKEVFEHVKSGTPHFDYLAQFVKKDGGIVDLSVNVIAQFDQAGTLLVVTGTACDVTERRRVAEKLLSSQKRESLTFLARGIAHEFNNLLAGILGHVDLSLLELTEDSPCKESMEVIKQSAIQAAQLTEKMLAYSGQGAVYSTKVQINELLGEMADLLGKSVGENISVSVKYGRDLPTFKADPAQVRQVLLNFFANAEEAIGAAKGQITVTTGVAEVAEGATDVKPGQYVWFQVSDTGCGIAEVNLPKVFDPFFSTKFTGKGLGLSAALGIVEGVGGKLEIDSLLGQGTSIKAYFPVSLHEKA